LKEHPDRNEHQAEQQDGGHEHEDDQAGVRGLGSTGHGVKKNQEAEHHERQRGDGHAEVTQPVMNEPGKSHETAILRSSI
jgi:hypothetical protein